LKWKSIDDSKKVLNFYEDRLEIK